MDYIEPGVPQPGEKWWPKPLDAWPLLNLALYTGRVRIGRIPVITPNSRDELVILLDAARRYKICLLPRGGGSGVLGGLSPRDCCVILDLSGLRNVIVYPEDYLVHAEPGVLLSELEDIVSRYGLTTGLEPQSLHVASIGGIVSTFGAGALQPGYGNIEDALVYLDIAFSNGRIARIGSGRRPRGYGLAGGPLLFAGSEGTLGVIIGVGLRLREKPKHTVSRTYMFKNMDSALRAARRIIQWSQPAIARIIDENEAMIFYGLEKPLLLAVFHDNESGEVVRALAGKLERIALSEGGVEVEDIYDSWRDRRYGYGELLAQLASTGLWFDTIDLQAPWSRLGSLHGILTSRIREVEGVTGVFSHLSHFYTNGGCLYTTIIMEQDPSVLARVWRTVMNTTLELGASVSHHHGVGLQKLYWIMGERMDELRVYCMVKSVLDPDNILGSHGLPSICRRFKDT